MVQTSRMPALADSMIESAQKAAGTKMMLASAPYRLFNGIEDRTVEVAGAALSGGNAAYHVGTVGHHFPGVKRGLLTGKTLDDNPRPFVDQNTHGAPFPDAVD
jgi:hypothetical protein